MRALLLQGRASLCVDDDDLDDDDDDDDDNEDDSCPPGVEQSLYDRVLELREKRLDQEEVLAEFQKTIDELRKTHDRHAQRLRQVDKDLAGANAEIVKFQQDKQLRLNQIDIIVSLTLSQIYCQAAGVNTEDEDGGVHAEASQHTDISTGSLESSGRRTVVQLPKSIDHCLVFGKRTLDTLRAQIGKLDQVRLNSRVAVAFPCRCSCDVVVGAAHRRTRRCVRASRTCTASIACSKRKRKPWRKRCVPARVLLSVGAFALLTLLAPFRCCGCCLRGFRLPSGRRRRLTCKC